MITFSLEESEAIDRTCFTNYWFSWKLHDDPTEVRTYPQFIFKIIAKSIEIESSPTLKQSILHR